MTPIAITVLVLALVVLWGGLIASVVFLVRRPDVTTFPPGGLDEDAREADAPAFRDT